MIRLLRKRVEPPKDRRVLLLVDGVSPEGTWVHGMAATTPHVRAWCEAPTATEPSGPVHSLEAEELPVEERPVLIRTERGVWMVGRRDGVQWWAHRNDGTADICRVDAWRPLPDDEPGDAELLEAARLALKSYRDRDGLLRDVMGALQAVVEKRSGKDGGK